MKTIVMCFVLLLLLPVCAGAQNMVNNAGFESYSHCPDFLDEIDSTYGWVNFCGTVDYFNRCSGDTVGVPFGWQGYQEPASGNAYIGLNTYYDYPDTREYLAQHLSVPLIPGHRYFVSFKTNLCFASEPGAESSTTPLHASKATNGIGVKFTTYASSHPPVVTIPMMDNHPAVYSSAIITDTANWTTVFGSFVADSAYKFIVLGNFFDDAHTARINIIEWGNTAYYLLDDICLSKDSAYAATYVGIDEHGQEAPSFSMYPNPAKERLHIDRVTNEDCIARVYNSLGELLYTKTEPGDFDIDVTAFRRGMYFVSIQTKKGVSTEKFIVDN